MTRQIAEQKKVNKCLSKRKRNNHSAIDNGVGISNDALSKLFDKRLNYTCIGTNNKIRTGLGLILCKEFIDIKDGKIWVESEIGKGSKFIFALPHKS